MDGEIKAESKLGEGTVIKFFVPLKSQAIADDEIAVPTEHGDTKKVVGRQVLNAGTVGQPPKILVAEDDEFGRAAVRMMLGTPVSTGICQEWKGSYREVLRYFSRYCFNGYYDADYGRVPSLC